MEHAVGLYVDAEQMVKNDELVSDRILTQSNTYIETCDIVKETQKDGIFQIKILAAVRRQALTKRIADTMPPQTYRFIDGGSASIHANLVTKAKRAEDSAALVKNLLKDYSPIRQLMKVGLVNPEPTVVRDEKNLEMVRLAYLLKVELDEKKYFEQVVPRFKAVLDQISLTPPKKIRLTDLSRQCDLSLLQRRLDAYLKSPNDSGYPQCDGGAYCKLHIYGGNLHGKATRILRGLFQNKWIREVKYFPATVQTMPMVDYSHPSFKEGRVLLVVSSNENGATALQYSLDPVVMQEFATWQQRICCETTEYDIVFKDAEDKELGGHPWVLEGGRFSERGNAVLINSAFSQYHNGPWGSEPFLVMNHLVGSCAQAYVKWCTFDFPADSISKIASVSIELVNND